MKPLMKTLLMMLLAVALLAACGDDTASNDATDSNDEATEQEENERTEEEEETDNNSSDNANEDEWAEGENETEENNNDSSGYAEDQQLSLGETGVYDSTLGTHEITLNSARIEDEVDGDSPTRDLFVITEVTIKNDSDEPIDAADLAVSPDLLDEQETADYPYWTIGFEEEQIEPGESITGEIVFDKYESSYYELVYGLHTESLLSNEVRWKFGVDEIE